MDEPQRFGHDILKFREDWVIRIRLEVDAPTLFMAEQDATFDEGFDLTPKGGGGGLQCAGPSRQGTTTCPDASKLRRTERRVFGNKAAISGFLRILRIYIPQMVNGAQKGTTDYTENTDERRVELPNPPKIFRRSTVLSMGVSFPCSPCHPWSICRSVYHLRFLQSVAPGCNEFDL